LAVPVFLVYRFMFSEEMGDMRPIRRMMRERRFGLQAMFGLTAAVAVTMGIMRGLGVDMTNPGAICLGLFIFVYAVAFVGLVGLMLQDLLGRRSSRRKLPDLHFEEEDPPADAESQEEQEPESPSDAEVGE